MAKKLIKAQAGKIVKSILKKRSVPQVFGAAATVGSGLAFGAAGLLSKGRKEFEEQQKTPEAIAQKKKYEMLEKAYKQTNSKKSGGAIKTKTKK